MPTFVHIFASVIERAAPSHGYFGQPCLGLPMPRRRATSAMSDARSTFAAIIVCYRFLYLSMSRVDTHRRRRYRQPISPSSAICLVAAHFLDAHDESID